MLPELSFFKMLLFCNIAFLLNYMLGHLFISTLRIKSNNFIFNDFIKCVSGALLIVFFYSSCKTNIFTINVLMVPIALLFFFLKKKEDNADSIKKPISYYIGDFSIKNLVYYALLLCLFFSIIFFKIKNPFTHVYYKIHADYISYALVIEFLNKTGVEGNIYEGLFSKQYQHTIYHFSELWYSAFFTKLFNIKSVFSLTLVFWPAFYLFAVLGVMSILIKLSGRISASIIFFSVSFLFIAGISFYIPKNTFFTRYDWWDLGVFYFSKISFPLVVLLLCVYLLISKKYNYFYLFLFLLPILSTATAPAVYIAASVYGVFLWYKRDITKMQFLQTVIIISTNFCFLLIYIYMVSVANKASDVDGITNTSIAFNLLQMDYIKTFINVLGGQIIKIILSCFLFLFLFLLINKHTKILSKNYNIFSFIFILNFAGLFSYGIFHRMVDSIQFWILFYIPLSALFCTLILYYLYQQNSFLYKLISVILVCICFYQADIYKKEGKIDTLFCERIYAAYMQKTENSNMVSLGSGVGDFPDIFSKNIITFIPNGYLKYFIDNYHPVSISSFDIPRDTVNINTRDAESSIIENSTFYKFVSEQKNKKTFKSVEKSQIDFIKSFKAGFILLSKNANVSPELNALIVDKIVSEKDNYSFCTLEY